MLHKIIKGIAPVAAIAMGAALSGCDGVNVRINDNEGVPLSELELEGAAPTEIVLAGPDKVLLVEGETLDIDVTGDQEAVDAIRFTLDERTLGIMRDHESRNAKGRATIRVAMPLAEEIVIAGSGELVADGLAENAEIVIGGSGQINVENVSGQSLEVNIGGSGSIKAAGKVDRLELNIGGSGNATMPKLKAEKAEINIGGSGSADFASDGRVEATVAGSGNVTVTGSATCTINSIGSGTLRCQPAAETADTPAQAKKTTKKRTAKAKRNAHKPGSSGPAKA